MQARMLVRRTAPWEVRAPFDVPADDGFIGLRRCGDSLIGVLAIAPDEPAPVVVGTPRATPPRLLPAVLSAMSAHDAAPWAIDVVSHTMRSWDDGIAAGAYRTLLGGLRIPTHRSVHLVVRIRPADCPQAVLMRGDGPAGMLRTALWCLRRLRARLADSGIPTRPLTAAEITDLTMRLTEGAPVERATSDALGAHVDGFRFAVHRWAGTSPESLSALLAAPGSSEAVSTTVTLSLTADRSGPRLTATVRDNGAHASDRDGCHDLVPVDASDRGALAAGLPIAAPPEDRRDDRSRGSGSRGSGAAPVPPAATEQICRSVAVPCAGDGQLVGAAASGAPVALRLAGPGVAASTICGDHRLARQVAARLAAIGMSVAVVSDTPQRWRRLADAVGERWITVNDRGPTAPHVLFDDTRAGGHEVPPGATLLRRHDCLDDGRGGREPTLRHDPGSGLLLASGLGCTVPVRPVSTAAERSLTELD